MAAKAVYGVYVIDLDPEVLMDRRLRPKLYRSWQDYPTRAEAERAEGQRALSLRKRGYAVWYGV